MFAEVGFGLYQRLLESVKEKLYAALCEKHWLHHNRRIQLELRHLQKHWSYARKNHFKSSSKSGSGVPDLRVYGLRNCGLGVQTAPAGIMSSESAESGDETQTGRFAWDVLPKMKSGTF